VVVEESTWISDKLVRKSWREFVSLVTLHSTAGQRVTSPSPCCLIVREKRQMATQESEAWGELGGKVVMVTGASSGLGSDFCLDLAKAGCRIVAAARRVDRLVSLCDQINNITLPSSSSSSASEPRSPRAVAVELDVCADAPTIEKSVCKAWEAFGHIDALVNNAGFRGNLLFCFSCFYNLVSVWLLRKKKKKEENADT
jgi:hypothetical protein